MNKLIILICAAGLFGCASMKTYGPTAVRDREEAQFAADDVTSEVVNAKPAAPPEGVPTAKTEDPTVTKKKAQ